MDKNIVKGPELQRDIDLNVGELTFICLNNFEDNVIQIDPLTEEQLTAGGVLRKGIRLAKFLKQHGIGHGDTVSIMSENRIEFCLVPVAAFFIGATFAPLNPDYTPNELKHTLNLSKPKVIFSSPTSLAKLCAIKKDHPYLKLLVSFDSNQSTQTSIAFNPIVKGGENDELDPKFQVPPYDPKETVATILCSSGTTGLPKGVMCTHDNITAFIDIAKVSFARLLEAEGDQEEECGIGIIPFFHSFGFMTMFLNILQGKPYVVLKKFIPKLFLDVIVKYKVRRLLVPPPISLFLVKNPIAQTYDLSCLKEVLVGAAPLPRDAEISLSKRFKVRHVGQSYGMTETTLGVMTNPPDKTKLGSVGIVMPGMMAKVIDDNGNALGPNQEEATRNCIDENGWLHTGDVAYYDDDQYFFIVDRMKELIKYNAFQVPPAELESLLMSHPGVLDAAVVGLPDDYAGELPLAFVVKKEDVNVTSEELQKYIAGQVSSPKQLRGGVRFIKEIPRNPSGKILRRVLKELAIKSTNSKL
ncbi:hypothetical protein HHI36_017797 [Cryptolaemus montrouzieri]|uniref:Uncharacterized protein n=1 Tax=Cryptolaemus montrouzieri TaxID=559131 RepID=A0ABD2NNM4_9CUCU